jgi:hypothetical protein
LIGEVEHLKTKTRLIDEERLNTKTEGSKRLGYSGLSG